MSRPPSAGWRASHPSWLHRFFQIFEVLLQAFASGRDVGAGRSAGESDAPWTCDVTNQMLMTKRIATRPDAMSQRRSPAIHGCRGTSNEVTVIARVAFVGRPAARMTVGASAGEVESSRSAFATSDAAGRFILSAEVIAVSSSDQSGGRV